jgi:hypothetical protein
MGKSDKGKGQRFLAQSLGFWRWVCCGLLLLHKRLLLGRRNVFAPGFVAGEGFDVLVLVLVAMMFVTSYAMA